MKANRPLLSIGIIFKNEIRCLERCMKSLQPLRDAIPCELVMADTGSDDGSRAVAEEYADQVFDFPWINDFAAARNAIMERASGEWFFTVDTDEYLDPDISDLTEKLPTLPKHIETCTVIQRNHDSYELNTTYNDFKGAVRILRMSTGMRYHGAIHERWERDDGKIIQTIILGKTILHHDGYIGLNGEAGREKRERNVKLLREELEKSPEALITYLQFIESGMSEPDRIEKLDQAVALIEAHKPHWNSIGPAILRYGVVIAYNEHLPDLEQRVQCAQKWFPASVYTRLDVECLAFLYFYDQSRYDECVRYGNRFLSALEKYRNGKFDPGAEMYSSVRMNSPDWELTVRPRLAYSQMKCGQYEEATETLEKMDFAAMDAGQTQQILDTLLVLHRTSCVNTTKVLKAFWSGISAQKDAESCKKTVQQMAARTFLQTTQDQERKDEVTRRCSYTLFVPLADECDIGLAAAMMETEDTEVLSQQLAKMESWKEFPLPALTHALQKGAAFPPTGKKFNLEEMDVLANCLAQDRETIISLAIQTAQKEFGTDLPSLMWAQRLVLAAVRSCDWKEMKAVISMGMVSKELPTSGTAPEQKFKLARAFVRTEQVFLPLCYTPSALAEDNLLLLPLMHRFGWYCVKAFEELDAGNAAEYVRLLRVGLERCADMNAMVEFLLKHTPGIQAPGPSSELKALADQVRSVLMRFSPDDPAVAMLKESEAYRKVAHLIEGIEVPVVGGLKQ